MADKKKETEFLRQVRLVEEARNPKPKPKRASKKG